MADEPTIQRFHSRYGLPDPVHDPACDICALVDEQANDEGLWFVAQTAAEAYLQQELRRLHAAIEAGREDH